MTGLSVVVGKAVGSVDGEGRFVGETDVGAFVTGLG